MRGKIYKIDENIYEVIKECKHCGKESVFCFDELEYQKLFVENQYIQDVFPNLSNEDREVMISGTHPNCWKEMFEDHE